MAREAKKQDAEALPVKSLEHLMLDQTHGKHALVPLAAQWALELRRREEYRHLTQQEILDLSLFELLSGKVAPDVVRAASEAARAAAGPIVDGKDKK